MRTERALFCGCLLALATLAFGNGIQNRAVETSARFPIRAWTNLHSLYQERFSGMRMHPGTRIAALSHPIGPGEALNFRAKVSDDGGTWLLFYAANPPEWELDYPVDFISGFLWQNGVRSLYSVNADPVRLVTTPSGNYTFSGEFSQAATTPPGCGYVVIGTWKEWTAEGEAFQPAASMQLLDL